MRVSRWFVGVLEELFGADIAVELSFPEDLERTPGGKVKPVTTLVRAGG